MSSLQSTPSSFATPPYRQIRALYDSDMITVYQAYSSDIALTAVEEQKLNASTAFRMTRTTWIKPSWCWMMYRSGYSFKDARQERILAIRMSHDGFQKLLSQAILTEEVGRGQGKVGCVRVQWDPERSARLEKLKYRSIQIGIPGKLFEQWIGEWIVGIDDVTERATKLKEVLDTEPEVTEEELMRRGFMPEEKPYKLPDELEGLLQMDL